MLVAATLPSHPRLLGREDQRFLADGRLCLALGGAWLLLMSPRNELGFRGSLSFGGVLGLGGEFRGGAAVGFTWWLADFDMARVGYEREIKYFCSLAEVRGLLRVLKREPR